MYADLLRMVVVSRMILFLVDLSYIDLCQKSDFRNRDSQPHWAGFNGNHRALSLMLMVTQKFIPKTDFQAMRSRSRLPGSGARPTDQQVSCTHRTSGCCSVLFCEVVCGASC